MLRYFCTFLAVALLTAVLISNSNGSISFLQENSEGEGDKIRDKRSTDNYFDRACAKWYKNDLGPPTDILSCPPILQQIFEDDRFEQDGATEAMLRYYHPGADFSFRQRTPSKSGAGQQCTYKNGKILVGPPGGGTADMINPSSVWRTLRHFRADVIPWFQCCKYNNLKSSCLKYYEKRPSHSGYDYEPPAISDIG